MSQRVMVGIAGTETKTFMLAIKQHVMLLTSSYQETVGKLVMDLMCSEMLMLALFGITTETMILALAVMVVPPTCLVSELLFDSVNQIYQKTKARSRGLFYFSPVISSGPASLN